MKLSVYEVAEVLDGTLSNVSDNLQLNNIQFDSRLITTSDLFVPLKGARDGHDFISTVFDKGCAVTLSEKEVPYPHILVDDCLSAFQKLASYYVKKMGVQVIAVTGSNGKTTTKDMIAAVLSTTYPTYKTQGNYNNEIGLPYTILQMPDDTEKLVLEMGQDHLGDIHILSKIAQPDLAIITLFGEAHLEFFGSKEEIAKGKLQISDGMSRGSTLILPNDTVATSFLPKDKNLVFFGDDTKLQVTDLVENKADLTFKVSFLEETLYLPVTGKYNAINAMLAAYVGQLLDVSPWNIQQALKNLELTKNRTEWKKAGNGADILSDVYNANPTAMKLILETFSAIPQNEGGKKITVLADMKELGEQSIDLHTQLIVNFSPDVFDTVIFYGKDIEPLAKLASQMFPLGKVYFFKKDEKSDQFDDMLKQILEMLKPQDQILLKGSNSMGLAKLVEALEMM